jgi:hypothetical protein
MLLDQIDELTAPIGTVTELLDAAIAALPAEPATGPAGPLVPPPTTDAAALARFTATVQRLPKIPGGGLCSAATWPARAIITTASRSPRRALSREPGTAPGPGGSGVPGIDRASHGRCRRS